MKKTNNERKYRNKNGLFLTVTNKSTTYRFTYNMLLNYFKKLVLRNPNLTSIPDKVT